MNKAVKLLIYLLIAFVVYQRSKFSHPKVVYYPPNKVLTEKGSAETENYYEVGQFLHTPQLSFYDKVSRKKINNYLFLVDNKHKVQIALIDLGYIQVLNANYFAGDETFSFEEKVGFKLPQDFKDLSLQINKVSNDFRLVCQTRSVLNADGRRSVQSTFDILIKRSGGQFSLKLSHIQPENSCITYIRQGVVSYKCYGGVGKGEINLKVEDKDSKIVTLSHQNTLVAFDGFRASGWQWNWVWGMGSGVDSFGQQFSINFGSIRQIGEDFIYLGSKVVKLNDFQYVLNENSTVGESISFKSISPLVNLDFRITAKEHKYQDMVVLKSDMIKFQGYWSGTYTDSETLNVISVENLPGLVQTADSIF